MSSWTQYLTSQGARFDANENALVEFNASEGTELPGDLQLIPLLEQGVLALNGPDAQKFLQGQLTCDLRPVNESRSTLGSYCTPKGNVVSCFRVLQAKDSLWLRMHQSLVPVTQSALGKYIVFSKAELVDRRESLVGLGLIGEAAGSLLQTLFGAMPAEVNEVTAVDGGLMVRVAGEQPRFELWLEEAAAQRYWPQLAEKARPSASHLWRAAEIRAGLACIEAPHSDEFLPHMLNLQAVGAISFDKGCYTGQEVVARMQYRGKLKRILLPATVTSGFEPAPGMPVHSAERKSIGQVLAWAPLGEQSYLVQLVVSKEIADNQQLLLDSQEGPLLDVLPLPYQLDPALFERSKA